MKCKPVCSHCFWLLVVGSFKLCFLHFFLRTINNVMILKSNAFVNFINKMLNKLNFKQKLFMFLLPRETH